MDLNLPTWIQNLLPNRPSGDKHKGQLAASDTPTVTRPLATQSGLGEHRTQISVEEAVNAGTVDGSYGVGNVDIVGDNAHLHFLDALTARHSTARHVIGHILRDDYQAIVSALSLLLPKIKIGKERALSSIDGHTSALKQQLLVRADFDAAGSPLAKKYNKWLVGLTYLALFAGDWSLIAVGFQIFGLSDKPWVPGIGVSDDLHLAAVSSVSALIVLGHFAAAPLRRIEHALRLRHRLAKEDRTASSLPAPFDWAWFVILLGLALCALYALSTIRTDYLASQGIAANGMAFLLLQMAIFSGALALGFAHQPDPDAAEWEGKLTTADNAVTATGAVQRDSLDSYRSDVGQYNGEVAHLGSVLAQAGHHVRADRNDKAVIAGDYYLRSYIVSQPGDQIAQQSILADGYDKLPEYSDEELRSRLTGVTPLPTFPLLSTRSVEQHLANRRAEVDRLRVRIDQKSIDALGLPDYEKPEDEPVYDDLLEDAVAAETSWPTSGSGAGAGADSTQPWLFPVQADEDDIVDAEVVDLGGDEESA